jgi:hypothetical protein
MVKKNLVSLIENWSSLAEQKSCGIEIETTCKYEKPMDLMIK